MSNDLIPRSVAVETIANHISDVADLMAATAALEAIPAVSTDSPLVDYLRGRGFEVTQVHVSHGVADLADAAVARAEKAEARVVELENNDAMEWQPIETAQRGPAIVFDAKKGVIPDAYIFSNDGRASYGYYKNTAYNVTHWMPQPKPPRAALEGGDA